MSDSGKSLAESAKQVVDLEAELESAANVSTEGDELAFAKARLHEWVESVVGVVAAPGSGRVTLIHANGSRSGITSPELPYQVAIPVRFDERA